MPWNAIPVWTHSVSSYLFKTLSGFMPDLGSFIPPTASRKVTQKSQNFQRPSCVPQLIHQKGIMLSPCLIHIKLVRAVDKQSTLLLPSLETHRGCRKSFLSQLCLRLLFFATLLQANKDWGVEESASCDNYRLHLKIIFLSRVCQPAHALTLRRKNSLCSIYCKENTIWSMENKGKNMYGLYPKAAKQLLSL